MLMLYKYIYSQTPLSWTLCFPGKIVQMWKHSHSPYMEINNKFINTKNSGLVFEWRGKRISEA